MVRKAVKATNDELYNYCMQLFNLPKSPELIYRFEETGSKMGRRIVITCKTNKNYYKI